MAIEKIEILGDVLELPARQHSTANLAHLPKKLGGIGSNGFHLK